MNRQEMILAMLSIILPSQNFSMEKDIFYTREHSSSIHLQMNLILIKALGQLLGPYRMGVHQNVYHCG
jgi:hypothetical protein